MASGDTLLIIDAHSAERPTSSAADLEKWNYRPVIAFDGGSSDEIMTFAAVMPLEYDAGGFRVILHFAMASATSGKVLWEVAFEKCTAEDMDTDQFASGVQTNPTVTVDKKLHEAIINFTTAHADSVTSADLMRLKVTRKASDTTNDTAAGDAYLVRIEVRER